MIKLLELFSGVGTASFALKRLNIPYRCVGYSDINKYANQIFKQNHCPDQEYPDAMGNWEKSKELGDVININPNNLEDFDLLTGGFPCSPAGTLVKTIDGYTPIEEICKHTNVLTHNNIYKPVVKIMSKIANHINIIKGVGCYDLRLTDEHPLYILRDGEFKWIDVKDINIKTDYLTYNINKESKTVGITANEAWLIGRYVADGSIDSRERLYFSIGSHKREEFEKHTSEYKKFVCHPERNCQEHFLDDPILYNYCSDCMVGSKNKEIPNYIINLPHNILMEFFNGYMSGDGHYDKGRDRFMYTTVSEKVALGMQEIIIKLFNKVPSISIRKDNRKESFNDTFNSQVCGVQKDVIVMDDKICVKIKNVFREDTEIEVFNFEVKKDNSYTLNNVIVHNCQAFSNAGKNLGELDTRGTLFNEIIRIAEVKQPRWMFLENVKGLISKRHKPTFDKIINELYRIGYFVKWKVLSTKDYGVPQSRERIFFCCFKNWSDFVDFEWPEKEELKLTLKDILEEEVDEKYFLSEKAILGKTKSNYQDRKPLYQDRIASTLKVGGDVKNIIVNEIRENRNIEVLENYIKQTFGSDPTLVDIYHLLHAEMRPITTFVPENQLIHRCLQAGVPKESLFIFNKWRKLTPTECWRLQGFRDGEIDVSGISDNQQYRLAGNGQSLNVVEKIFNSLFLNNTNGGEHNGNRK